MYCTVLFDLLLLFFPAKKTFYFFFFLDTFSALVSSLPVLPASAVGTGTLANERVSCCCCKPISSHPCVQGFPAAPLKTFCCVLCCSFTEGKMQAWGLEGLGGTSFLLFLSGLLACTQQLLIVGYKDSWLQSNIADFEHHRCFAKQDVVKINCAIELSREKAISYVSKGAFLQCFWYGIQDRRYLLA